MPLLALSAKARLMVPVGAMDSRCELRSPCWRMRSFSGCGSREVDQIFSALALRQRFKKGDQFAQGGGVFGHAHFLAGLSAKSTTGMAMNFCHCASLSACEATPSCTHSA